MLDSTPFVPVMTDAWRDHLAYGDIVVFRFPHTEGEDAVGVKARPCLVLDIVTLGDDRYALLAYGTTSQGNANTGDEIFIRKPEVYGAVGLTEPTRFVGARRVLVRLTHRGFVQHSGTESPVVGQLTGAELDRLNVVRARIHALRDIAADRRSISRRRRPVSTFTVETRQTKSRQLRTGGAV